jgi:GDPmannose 4,6-dehydratase
MTKTAVIFGVTGQDGSFLSEFLLDKGYRVVGVARRVSTDNTQRISSLLNNGLELVGGDVTDSHSVYRVLRDFKPEEVYNLAAQSHVGTSFNQASTTWDITAKGCLNILEVMRDLGGRFYQASSSEMFGDSFTVEGDNKYQDEDTVFNPQSPYAIAKVAAHQATRLYRGCYGLHASCGILFNHESERRGEKFVTRKITKWIGGLHKFIDNIGVGFDELIHDGDDLKVDVRRFVDTGLSFLAYPKLRLGNLSAQRDWGYAKDYVEAMWLMLQQDEPNDYVICTGETYSVEDFLIASFKCINIANHKPFVVVDPKLKRPSEVPYLKGSYRKAHKLLGWKPKNSFKDLVKLMTESDLANDVRS